VKPLLPVLLAGGTFAAAAVLGFFAGILAAQRFSQSLLAPGGLAVGGALGGYWALRLLLRSMR
jgi:hypothetical protein